MKEKTVPLKAIVTGGSGSSVPNTADSRRPLSSNNTTTNAQNTQNNAQNGGTDRPDSPRYDDDGNLIVPVVLPPEPVVEVADEVNEFVTLSSSIAENWFEICNLKAGGECVYKYELFNCGM